MRKMLLSFRPDVYERIAKGEKIYEHRRVFPNEPILAYAYISSPVKAIAGIMILDNRKDMSEWIEEYAYDPDAISRIEDYLTRSKYAMEIQSFQDTNRLELKDLRERFPDFVCPQMYYYLDDTPLLNYIENELVAKGNCIEHTFKNISSNAICIH